MTLVCRLGFIASLVALACSVSQAQNSPTIPSFLAFPVAVQQVDAAIAFDVIDSLSGLPANGNSDASSPPDNVICVDCSRGSDANDGADWSQAVATIQRALALAASNGARNEIWIAAGTYTTYHSDGVGQDEVSDPFVMSAGVRMYGGFVGTETERERRDWDSNATVLLGQNGATLVSEEDHTCSSIVDGFTIRGGDTGLRLNKSTLTISHNVIEEMGTAVSATD